uniref:Uncharacterized protein n=1 Tax=Anopheles epiroticus TaxID=199890 RepID=A0A182PT66_9DIPT
MAAWRAAGLNYINYSNIAARLLRKALKPELRAQAVRRDDSHIKFTKWQNGKPESKYRGRSLPCGWLVVGKPATLEVQGVVGTGG